MRRESENGAKELHRSVASTMVTTPLGFGIKEDREIHSSQQKQISTGNSKRRPVVRG
jgi:hypothetical protein